MTITSTSKLRYTELTDELIPILEVIEHEAYPEPWTTGMFREEMRNRNSYFYVAYLRDTLIGYSGFWLLVDDAHVTSVTVASHHRGNHYGREQMEHLLNEAKALNACTATLEVRESNLAARKMYEAFGFDEIGIRRGYYAKSKEDAVVMQLQLQDKKDGPDE